MENERHIDLFADLNLGLSDDEDGNNDDPGIVREGIAQLVPLLPRSEADAGLASLPSQESRAKSSAAGTSPQTPPAFSSSKRKGKRKKATKASNKKTSPWADKCMYAELLEMHESVDLWDGGGEDGLPGDLETGWVALAPVPVGKRCLAISHQGGGIIGAGASIVVLTPMTRTERSLRHQHPTRRSALVCWVNPSCIASLLRCRQTPCWIASWIRIGRRTASFTSSISSSGRDRTSRIANRLSGRSPLHSW